MPQHRPVERTRRAARAAVGAGPALGLAVDRAEVLHDVAEDLQPNSAGSMSHSAELLAEGVLPMVESWRAAPSLG